MINRESGAAAKAASKLSSGEELIRQVSCTTVWGTKAVVWNGFLSADQNGRSTTMMTITAAAIPGTSFSIRSFLPLSLR